MADNRSIILHHYAASPFAEKIRLALRIKNLAWVSVDQPSLMPKPDLVALTGGYRRIPVLQIGADVYCDTRLILDELEARYTLTPLKRSGHDGLEKMVSAWTDRILFPITASLVFAALGDALPKAFLEDRSAMMGRPIEMATLKTMEPTLRGQFLAQCHWIEDRLADARGQGNGDFLLGSKPGLIDVHAAFCPWFVRERAPEVFADLEAHCPLTVSWLDRLYEYEAQTPETLDADAAIDLARQAAPRLIAASANGLPKGVDLGAEVQIVPDDYARDPVAGRLVQANARQVTIVRSDDRAETVHVHFPRVGYVIQPLG